MKKQKSFLTTIMVMTMSLSACNSMKSISTVNKEDGVRKVGLSTWNKTGSKVSEFSNSNVPNNYTRFVFMRLDTNNNVADSINIAIDERFHVNLQNSRYSSILVCSGGHKIDFTNNVLSSKKSAVRKKVNTKSKSTQYFSVKNSDKGIVLKKLNINEASQLINTSHLLLQTHQINRVADTCKTVALESEVNVNQRTLVKKHSNVNSQVTINKPINLNLQFDFDKATIRPIYNERLANVASFMNKKPNTVVYLKGHTDSKGSATYNLDLSNRRAISVYQELNTKYGISTNRISAKGYGEEFSIATNETTE